MARKYQKSGRLSTFSRIYGCILAKLVESEYQNMEMEKQSGFQAGSSCIDKIFT